MGQLGGSEFAVIVDELLARDECDGVVTQFGLLQHFAAAFAVQGVVDLEGLHVEVGTPLLLLLRVHIFVPLGRRPHRLLHEVGYLVFCQLKLVVLS